MTLAMLYLGGGAQNGQAALGGLLDPLLRVVVAVKHDVIVRAQSLTHHLLKCLQLRDSLLQLTMAESAPYVAQTMKLKHITD